MSLEEYLVAAYVGLATGIVALWSLYFKVYRDSAKQVEEAFKTIRKKRNKLSRSFLQMLARESSEEEISRILNNCFMPLQGLISEISSIRKEYYREPGAYLRLALFPIAGLIWIFEALATTAYFASKNQLSSIDFIIIFMSLSLVGLVLITIIYISGESKREKRAKHIKDILELMEESASKGTCMEELEEMLEEAE